MRKLVCQQEIGCQNEVACIGSYEGSKSWSLSCNEHCGHGCEDGRCIQINDMEGLALMLVVATDHGDDEPLDITFSNIVDDRLANVERSVVVQEMQKCFTIIHRFLDDKVIR